jgi:hypothetical protein
MIVGTAHPKEYTCGDMYLIFYIRLILLALSPNTVPIEENDCTKIDICHIEQYGDHWSCRAIKERSKNDNIKITQEELKEFLRITKSTFGVFQIDRNDPLEKRYLLLYLVL